MTSDRAHGGIYCLSIRAAAAAEQYFSVTRDADHPRPAFACGCKQAMRYALQSVICARRQQ